MTDTLLRFSPVFPVWAIASLCVTVALLLVWLEIKKRTRFKFLRTASAVVLVLAIAGLLLQPKIKKLSNDFSVLVTENSNQAILDSLREKFPGASLLYFDGNKNSTQANVLNKAHEIPSANIKLVIGDGLSPSAADVMLGTQFSFLPSSTPEGIINLVLPKNAKVATRATLHGILNSTSDSSTLILEGPGGKEDSIRVNGGIQVFSLSFLPKQPGKISYSISINGKKEIFPIEVERETVRKILVIQMFPTFETGYLKNVLAKTHQLVFRYQLSKNNFRYEYINHQAIRADRLTSEILRSFDLVILDSDALALLSPAERKNVDSSVRLGLGVLILPNENPRSARALNSILPIQFNPYAKDTATLRSDKAFVVSAWPVQAVNRGQIIPTIQNNNRILAGYTYSGFGKIGFNLLQETYKLMLEGDSTTYKNLWSMIIQKNSRSVQSRFQIKVKNDFPIHPDEPVTIQVIGSTETPPTLLHDSTEIPMIEDPVIDDMWTTKVWPDNTGWHEVRIKGDSSKHAYFVSKPSDWKSLRAANSIRNTKLMSTSEGLTSNASWEYRPFAPIIFYLMFLIAAAALWLVPKI